MDFTTLSNKNILWSCLNWGLGHVYRSIPIIRELQLRNNHIRIACDETQQVVFERYLDFVEYHYVKGYKFHFTVGKSLMLSNIFHLSDLFKQYVDDYNTCEHLVKKHNIDCIVSDHRYGFCSKKVPSVFLTHQLQLPTNSKWLQKMHRHFIHSNFSNVWVLDNAQHQFAGKLSEITSIKKEVQFIGIFSRFKNEIPIEKKLTVAIISGPKPFNEKLLETVKKQAHLEQKIVYCISTLPFNDEYLQSVLPSKEDDIIQQAATIISHCGYTTLMDLHYLQPKRAILIPTPKQAEQLYLSEMYANKYKILTKYEDL